MHSASASVKRLVEVFQRVHREGELHREILAFSIPYDNEAVRIYGHCAVINNDDAYIYHHLIRKIAFTDLDGNGK